ncbi:hypothetical protein UFOVP606_35 [uncultured Caudovirales phage]|uniref:Uncharacterized protein n=1 Tax=uncultured Caudovirales phage TaxID=2100421 RepID=A0A6J5N055_9CAUD|nr:hypothetical protein UFOVP606_35 [uncultured Caudovirales phage]
MDDTKICFMCGDILHRSQLILVVCSKSYFTCFECYKKLDQTNIYKPKKPINNGIRNN